MNPPQITSPTLNLPPFTTSSLPLPSRTSSVHYPFHPTNTPKLQITITNPIRVPLPSHCINPTTDGLTISAAEDESLTHKLVLPPVKKKRKAYRRLRPGEAQGISEEMRFVAMKLRHKKLKLETDKLDEMQSDDERESSDHQMWDPELDGFLRYLVDSHFVFSTIERMVDQSQDVSFAYFRHSGLERSESFAKDIEWLGQQDVTIPEPLFTSKKYVKYLEELAAQSPPLFFCHLYNIYFSHIAGGQVIARKVRFVLYHPWGVIAYSKTKTNVEGQGDLALAAMEIISEFAQSIVLQLIK